MNNITKIVLTGGPCAGKTTALARIIEKFSDMGYLVLALPEAATLFNQAGVNFSTGNREYAYIVEKSLLGFRFDMEDRFEALARTSRKPIRVICVPKKTQARPASRKSRKNFKHNKKMNLLKKLFGKKEENLAGKETSEHYSDEEIKETVNQTFSGIAFFYRDTELDGRLISKYKAGQIITEKGFTDMTYKKGGLSGNLRYLIASAHARNLSMFEANAEQFGHVVLSHGACFKVLDIYRLADKTQILLLEIPAPAADFFSKVEINLEKMIIDKAREDFNENVNSDPVPELRMQEWRERTEFPIGMNEEGEFLNTINNKQSK